MGGGGGVGAGGSGYMDESPGVVIFPDTGSFIVGVPYTEGGSILRFSEKKKKKKDHCTIRMRDWLVEISFAISTKAIGHIVWFLSLSINSLFPAKK